MTQAPASHAKPLEGQALLDRYNALKASGFEHAEIAVECGYYGVIEAGPRAGAVRANSTRFDRAILEAQGFLAPSKSKSQSQGKRSGANSVVVGKAGRATISLLMLEKLGAVPGDRLDAQVIEVNGKPGLQLSLQRSATAAEAAPSRVQLELTQAPVAPAVTPELATAA